MTPSARAFHVPDNGAHAVVITFDVDLHDAIKVLRRGALDCADVRNARIIDENVDSLAAS